MNALNRMNKFISLALVFLIGLFSSPTFAALAADAKTAVEASAADALTVGSAVAVAVAGLVVVGLVIGLVKKL